MRKDWRFFIKSQYKAKVPILSNDTIQHCTKNARAIKEQQKEQGYPNWKGRIKSVSFCK